MYKTARYRSIKREEAASVQGLDSFRWRRWNAISKRDMLFLYPIQPSARIAKVTYITPPSIPQSRTYGIRLTARVAKDVQVRLRMLLWRSLNASTVRFNLRLAKVTCAIPTQLRQKYQSYVPTTQSPHVVQREHNRNLIDIAKDLPTTLSLFSPA